jgi:ribosomal protein S18 acetylase RimI-like enzyme
MDTRVQNSVITNLGRRPQTVDTGAFRIGWDTETDSRFINYATPHLGASPTPIDVAELVAAFREIGRVPRLEYVVSCAPDLETHLLAAGFAVEARHEYLICSPDSLVVPPEPAGVDIAMPESDEELAAMVAAQQEAFGGAFTSSAEDVARMRRLDEQGGVVMLARSLVDGVVGGGQATPINVGLSEVAGIAVRSAHRRRGIAGAVTAAITARAFGRGAELAWLEASGDTSWRVYDRVGYAPAGQRLYIALDALEDNGI